MKRLHFFRVERIPSVAVTDLSELQDRSTGKTAPSVPPQPIGDSIKDSNQFQNHESGCDDNHTRTTLEIDDDVMRAAREMARLKNQGIGRTISDLARRGLTPDATPARELEFGIPVWKHGPGAVAVTSEMVSNLADDE